MVSKDSLTRACREFKKAHSVFIAAHIMPDGDCLGSQLALGHALRAMGKRVTLSLDDRIPDTYNFLAGIKEISSRPPGIEELFVFVDGSEASRYGKAYDREKIGARPTILIDHHATNDPFAELNLVDPNAASTAEIVQEVLRVLNAPMTRDVAQALLTGIVTDTLGFRTLATTPETMEQAAALVRAGGSIPDIIDSVYNRRSYNSLCVMGQAIANSKLEGSIIWSQVDYPTMKALGLNGNGTSGIVNMLLSVADARIAFFLVEKEDGRIDLGLRSRANVDISGVAKRLGGGGHKQAAGALLPPPFETAAPRVFKAIHEDFGK